MRNYIGYILLMLLVSSCDDIPNGIVENNFSGYKVLNLEAPFSYQPKSLSDNFKISAEFDNTVNIDSVWFNVLWTGNNKKIVHKVNMADNGSKDVYGDKLKNDKIYSGKTTAMNKQTSGKYKLEIIVRNKKRTEKTVALRYFQHNSTAQNVAPVISGVSMTDTVNAGSKFVFTVDAKDGNGLSDIIRVYYELYKPDGSKIVNSKGVSEFPLFDNGNNDDQKAYDGKFTSALTFPAGYPTGKYKFDFTAVDKAGAKSNVISHNLVVN